MTNEACSAIVKREREGLMPENLCLNGFPVTGPCLGATGIPTCCREELCGRIYEANGGKPKPITV